MKEIMLTTIGGLSALAASTCCLLPLALVFVGAGGAWSAGLSVMAPFQPLFLAVAVVSLGAAFWLVYGRSELVCENGVCAGSLSRRFLKNMLLLKALLWLGAIIATLSLLVL